MSRQSGPVRAGAARGPSAKNRKAVSTQHGNHVAYAQLAALEDLRPQAAAVHQALSSRPPGVSFSMVLARLAQLDAAQSAQSPTRNSRPTR